MNIALIPPSSQLHHCLNRPIQMLIPAFTKDEAYRRYYREFGTNLDYYVILDNGAYEGAQLTSHDLLGMAVDYKVDEIIAPDKIGDADETIYMLSQFMSHWRHPSNRARKPRKVMAVVQGQSMEECQSCIRRITRQSDVTTLGIPKHLVETTGQVDVRIQLMRWVLEHYPDIEIHLLGYTREGELMVAAELGARSLDTSAPFTCTAENMSLSPRDTWDFEIPKRQQNFGELGPEYFHPRVLRQNIDLIDKWATYDGLSLIED